MDQKINIMSNLESLDLSKDTVISALLNGGNELRRLRRLVKEWVNIQKSKKANKEITDL